MAITVINLSDPISTLVTKTNTISSDMGDKASLATDVTTNLVAAINEINTKIADIDTAAEIAAKVEQYFDTEGHVLDVRGFHADSANVDSATITTLTSTTGTFNTLRSNVTLNAAGLAATGKSTIDSAEITTLRMDGAGSLQHLKPLQIKNSSGTVVLAGYILSTSNTDGTI
tara:strand:+ start:7752 stop:8267 length:516 start_codon:yes stop_codon:yes gene_type:complete